MFARQAFFCISTVLHFFVNVKKYCKTLWKPTLGTSNFESKFNRSQKNLITFVEYLLILFIRIWWRGCFLTNPNGYFFFYSGWGSKISCKINAFYGSGPCMRLKKVLLQSPEVEWCANTSCQWHPTTETLSFKFHKWNERLL